MSLADNILRRRQELEGAFRPRYNPMESVVSALSDIEQQAFKRQGEEARRKQEAEKFGLEKTETEARTKQLQAQADKEREDRAALAQRRLTEAAAEREKMRRDEQAASLKTAAEHIGGLLHGRGQTAKDLYGGATVAGAEKDYAARMARALAEGTPEDVAKLDAELAATQKAAPKTVPGGITMDQAQEIADAYGAPVDAVMAEIMRMEAESEKGRAELGLTGAKTKTQEELARLYGRKGWPKPEHVKTPEEIEKEKDDAEKRKLGLAAERLKNEMREMQMGKMGGFHMTPQRINATQEARQTATDAKTGITALRSLIAKYPQIEEYTGPLDNIEAWAAQKFGAQSQQQAEIRSTIQQIFQTYKRIQTGTAAGNQEMAALQEIMPSTTDKLPAILGKIQAYENLVGQQIANWDRQLATLDIRAADVTPGVVPMPKPAPSQQIQDDAAALGGTLR